MPGREFYVLVYDVVDDKRRLKVARALEAVGERVQYSVFEAYLTPQELEKLLKRIKRVFDEGQDQMRVYNLCNPCREKVITLGAGEITRPPGLMIV